MTTHTLDPETYATLNRGYTGLVDHLNREYQTTIVDEIEHEDDDGNSYYENEEIELQGPDALEILDPDLWEKWTEFKRMTRKFNPRYMFISDGMPSLPESIVLMKYALPFEFLIEHTDFLTDFFEHLQSGPPKPIYNKDKDTERFW